MVICRLFEEKNLHTALFNIIPHFVKNFEIALKKGNIPAVEDTYHEYKLFNK